MSTANVTMATKEPIESTPDPTAVESVVQLATPPKKKPPRKPRPNYNKIHSKPLPVETYPLPAFHPSQPLSLLRLVYTYLSHLLSPPDSHGNGPYLGLFSAETRSVHVTDPKHLRALWEMGFFGKGTLSRSEPSWVEREKEKFKAERYGGRFATAEQATQARREERRLFKLERARLEKEKVERQRAIEQGRLDPSLEMPAAEGVSEQLIEAVGINGSLTTPELTHGLAEALTLDDDDLLIEEAEPDIENQEHLQLTLEEAFFLTYGLGVLKISADQGLNHPQTVSSSSDLLSLFCRHSSFPPQVDNEQKIAPDSQFLLKYVVYHHFRSLGWVVRPGAKFSVDYLLYNRGPVFSHAEFAVLIVPAYTHPYWNSATGLKERAHQSKDWWWLHCANRVQSQVRKTLVLVYVDVPPPHKRAGRDLNVGELLKGYKIREFVVRRWLANRSRD